MLTDVLSHSHLVCVEIKEQKTNLSNLRVKNQELITERSILEKRMEAMSKVSDNLNQTLGVQLKEKEELRRETENLNWTLGVILKFDNFPVNVYCPEKSEYIWLC